jgi:hypothetical protein
MRKKLDEKKAKVFIPLKEDNAVCVRCNNALGPTEPRLRLSRVSICLPCLSMVLGKWVQKKKEWLMLAQNYLTASPRWQRGQSVYTILNRLADLRREDPITASLLEALD